MGSSLVKIVIRLLPFDGDSLSPFLQCVTLLCQLCYVCTWADPRLTRGRIKMRAANIVGRSGSETSTGKHLSRKMKKKPPSQLTSVILHTLPNRVYAKQPVWLAHGRTQNLVDCPGQPNCILVQMSKDTAAQNPTYETRDASVRRLGAD